MVLRHATSLRGALKGVGPENRDFFGLWNGTSEVSAIWAPKRHHFQCPPLLMPWVMMLQPSKPLSISTIKTTGTLVVLCTQVLLCTVVVCCCVLLCVVVCCCVLEGRGGLLVAVLCEQVGAGSQASPSPSHYSLVYVSMDACWWVAGCYSYIRFDPSLAVRWLAHPYYVQIPWLNGRVSTFYQGRSMFSPMQIHCI